MVSFGLGTGSVRVEIFGNREKEVGKTLRTRSTSDKSDDLLPEILFTKLALVGCFLIINWVFDLTSWLVNPSHLSLHSCKKWIKYDL